MRLFAPAVALALVVVLPAVASAAPADDISRLAAHVDRALVALEQGDAGAARTAMAEFNSGWRDVEDGVRALSRSSYRGIEDAQADANIALEASPLSERAARSALQRLRAECDAFILSFPGTEAPATTSTASTSTSSLVAVVGHLATANTRLAANDVAGARAEVDAFARAWPDVEGQVKVHSPRVYTDTENNTARAKALLSATAPQPAAAQQVLTTMQSDLQPIAQGGGRYTAFDAGVILLREGLEALLVVGALLTFLVKSGNADKSHWIYAGGGVAIAASLAVALLVNLLFAQTAAGTNRELIEGLTGLVAAGMLLYVSHWLHSKSSLGAWQRYIHQRGTAALARNSVLSLAMLAFLAVFREGAETILFYVGIAPAISLSDLALGIGGASVLLAVCGVLMLRLGVRLSLRPFFLVTSVLIYYLAFKFIGAGLHALQVSGMLSATPQPFLPSNDVIGLFPTLETTLAQGLLVLATVGVLLLGRARTQMRTA